MTLATCPADDRLLLYVLGQVPGEEAAEVDLHLANCSTCVSHLDNLQEEKDDLVSVIRARSATPLPRNPVLEQLRQRIRALPAPAASNVTTTVNALTGGHPLPSGPLNVQTLLAPAQAADELGRLGNYRVFKVLGAGGMGVVFHAEDSQLLRPVALKVLKPELAANPDFRQRFLREAQMAAALQHDHVVTIYQVSEEGGVPLLAMQLLEGESLEQRLARAGKLPLAEVLRIGREIAAGLQAAHARGLIHRDIKPANIWLEQGTGRVKILDFGLARPTNADDARLTQAGTVLGTPAYMAPEQAEGRLLDGRCDLFSLGCVLYRLATGAPAFTGLTPLAVMKAVTTVEPPAANVLNPEVPPALSELIQRLLAKNPDDRPATAQGVVDMLEVLERAPHTIGSRAAFAKQGTPLLRHPESPAGSGPARRRLASWLAAAAAGLLAVVAGAALLPYLLAPGTPEGDDKKKENITQEKKPDTTDVGQPVSFAALVSAPTPIKGLKSWNIEANEQVQPYDLQFSDDGRQLTILTITGDGIAVNRGHWDFSKATLVPAKSSVPPTDYVVTSPDGKFQVRYSGVSVELLEAGAAKPFRTLRELGQVTSVLFSPDSSTLAVAATGSGYLAVDPKTGNIRKQFRKEVVTPCLLGWLEDGKSLVAGEAAATQLQLVVLDFKEGKMLKQFTVPGYSKVHKAMVLADGRIGHADFWPGAHLSPNRKRVAVFHTPNNVTVLNAATLQEVRTVKGKRMDGGFRHQFWSADGRLLAFLSEDNTAQVLDVDTGKVTVFKGHAKAVGGLALSPDGKTLATFSGVRLWSTATGQHLGSLAFFPDGDWLAVSPDGHYRGSKGADKYIVYVAKTPDGKVRDLSPAEFAKQYGWQNQPERVLLTEEARGRPLLDPIVEKK